jgi:hypothetical protein
VICQRCNEPIAYGESHATLYDAGGQASYVHLVRIAGRLEEHCPELAPVGTGEAEESR